MNDERLLMPDGSPFAFWQDQTSYERVYHVNAQAATAADDNPGTEDRPLATIGRAAALLRPGQKAVIHGGIYREFIQPACGGEAADRMIAYEAAAGESVVVKGSRLWQADFRPSEGWNIPSTGGATVWMGDLPIAELGAGNPFALTNVFAHLCEFTSDWSRQELERLQMRRGLVFANGQPLKQVLHPRQLAQGDMLYWVEDPGTRIHFRLPGDVDPRQAQIEVTVQEQVFAPRQRHMGYIRISGITFEHAADGVPVPQRAMVSTWRGHHWIIEDCHLRHANAVGLDIGNEDWRAAAATPCGGHVVRRNRLSHCGVCGLAGVGSVDGALLEDNLIEHVGGRVGERLWETAGCKLHVAKRVLIRRNVFRHMREASGLWLDYLNENCRVTGNVFADIESILGGLYLEVSHAPNLIDGNLFWDIRLNAQAAVPALGGRGAPAVSADTGEAALVVNNLFGRVRHGFAVAFHLNQKDRLVGGRVGLCRRNGAFNNLFVECPRRIFLAQVADNRADGNLYDQRDGAASFYLQFPTGAALDLPAWQEFLGLDAVASEVAVEADFDVDKLVLRLQVGGRSTAPAAAASPAGLPDYPAVGPFTTGQWTRILGDGLELPFP